MRLGVMGGTFDPIHYGHLFIAEEARAVFSLDRVLFIPNGSPPHKQDEGVVLAKHRYEMCSIATANNRFFACDDTEMQGAGPFYAVDTLSTLESRWPGADLHYIAGVDALADLMTWRRHADVVRLSAFIAATRPGYSMAELSDCLPPEYMRRIEHIDSVGLDISSTDIRVRIASGLPIRYLLPDEVIEYIHLHGLYSNEKNSQVGSAPLD